jgi:RNA polymerase-binding protein DksA
MIQAEDLQKIRQQLEEELARLLEHGEAYQDRRGRRKIMNPDRDDLAHNFASRERRLALRDVEKVQVVQIEKALERIANGTYGICVNCGEVIAPERLEIIPYAALCVRCQQEQDQK